MIICIAVVSSYTMNLDLAVIAVRAFFGFHLIPREPLTNSAIIQKEGKGSKLPRSKLRGIKRQNLQI